MSTLLIEGGRRLSGRITVDGNKNSALPLVAACLLSDETCRLENVPRISDIRVMADLLTGVGARVSGLGTPSLEISTPAVTSDTPDPKLVGRLRGSVLLMGPLLARTGRVRLAPPGGDFPTRRTIATHVQALVALGARVVSESGYELDAPGGLRGASFYLDEASVTGTETAVLAAAAAEGVSEIRHAATEPHVVELCEFLQAMGVPIEGAGTSTIRIEGRTHRKGATHRLHGDYIEAGSWAVVAAITGGTVDVRGVRAVDMEPITSVLQRMKLNVELESDGFKVLESRVEAINRLTTGLWPGFPSDMVSLVTVLATQAEGETLIHDWMYELRLFALEQLSGMRADLFLCDPHRIVVSGPNKLRGRALDSRDLRSGMALIAAALAADGRSTLGPLETVERGYTDVVERLKSLGAAVEVAPS
ncbi:MAG TPA: UDP-N-acetylglucosamine 1-carboxyvinyltransferase [Vicinamibacterales bacterium]|jgi:UDP-N-acetylglucosamine 1-carboxyvinyltransferase|nr:UDP-N-acetylglucosamine 1-carboxyvinyltransferase [Vicinamibacterales bacterium]